jgi:hypothetical protein
MGVPSGMREHHAISEATRQIADDTRVLRRYCPLFRFVLYHQTVVATTNANAFSVAAQQLDGPLLTFAEGDVSESGQLAKENLEYASC